MAAAERKTKKNSRSRRTTPGWGLRWWLLGLALAVIVGGIGALKWARTGQGRAALLTIGSQKMYEDVQTAVDQALVEALPGYAPGPALLLGTGGTADEAPGVGSCDWPAPQLGAGAAIRCREVVVPDGQDWWTVQQRIAQAVEAVGARVLWGERLAGPDDRQGDVRPSDAQDLLRLDLGVAGKPTHTLLLRRESCKVPPRWDRWPGRSQWTQLLAGGDQPTVALVIDDWGYARNEATSRILDLPVPLTMAVLPGLSFSRHFALQGTPLVLPPQSGAAARGAGDGQAAARDLRRQAGCPVEVSVARAERPRTQRREILLHLPMQPQNYPETDPGRDAILVGMDRAEIRARLDDALRGLPMATGVNNHMGSAATSDRATMGLLMDQLAERGLIFLDSLTTSRSVAYEVALEHGLPALRNRIFLDYDHEDEARIAANLAALVRSARSTGFAVGIGHPHPATAQVLARELPRLAAEGVRFVTVSEMLALKGAVAGAS